MNFSVNSAVEILSQTPSTISSLLGGLSSEWTRGTDNRDDWSPYDVVGHLIHSDETNWIPRAKVILANGSDRSFVDFDRFGQFEKARGRILSELLLEFSRVRTLSIETLNSWDLTPEKLSLTGIHPEFGEVTLEQLLSTWVVHDLGHIKQMVTYLARRYSEDVGPWKKYLSILN